MVQTDVEQDPALRTSFFVRLTYLGMLLFAILLIVLSNLYLTDRFTRDTRNRAELRLALYSSSVVADLQRAAIVPLLMARDPFLITSLNTSDYAATTQRLISVRNEIDIRSMMLLDDGGRVVATTERAELGTLYRNAPFYVSAIRSNETIFSQAETPGGAYRFYYARRLESEKLGIGVIAVEVDLGRFERRWAAAGEAVALADSTGHVILSSDPAWRGKPVESILRDPEPPSAIDRALSATDEWASIRTIPDAYFQDTALLRLDGIVPFQGWRMTYFTAFAPVRDRVNGILAVEITAFALLVALISYFISRRARYQTVLFKRESIELRRLANRLKREIGEREKAELNLRVAEQSLAQSSKLAALGEMSAGVSHELNQPLAAMKTYLAGARLLLQRNRTAEAITSFQRIDDLIERMSAITRQLKTFARKGSEERQPLDLRDAVASALAMMTPQLNKGHVALTQTIADEPVVVLADQVRLEQVIVNLFRNALDAMKGSEDQALDVLLTTAGENAILAVRDNGHGIENLDALFEPFYTTKQPGDGVGLGLAISSGIINDLGGRLSARNAEPRGAVFEVQLPLSDRQAEAAE